ncbi:MAG: DUF2851 family protein [Rhodothermaceae bacterium]|nr:DUF2851 family protein [Rhodothermaceae bacterium]
MHERLLHTAWADLAFKLKGLMTLDGDRLEIIDQGRLNGGSGPDFSMACLRIGGLRICGSVEIHLRASDWYRHGHQRDPAYNNVILHTVLEDDLGRRVELEDGTHPPTFCIKSCLSPSFLRILEMGSSRAIPCAGQISYISDEVIEKQLASAGREYFGEKTRKLLTYYDEHLPLTDAWRKMLLHAIFDILGVHLKGCRPASSPHVRIPQAVYLYNRILEFDIRSIPGNDPADSWKSICNYGTNPDSARPGADTLKTCFYTAFLPCAYILGNLIHSNKLQKSAYSHWEKARLPFAGQISKPLSEADERFSLHAGSPGSLYQFRNFCRQRRCDECRIFSALLSA